MERRASLKHNWLGPLLLGGLLFCAVEVRAADALVLVVRADSPIRSMDSLSVRKAFVGLTVSVDGITVRPVINNSQPALHTAFLQHVVGLSEQMYQRRTLTLALQQGRALPPVYTEESELVRALVANPNTVSFMWQSAADRAREIRSIRVLWRD